MASANGTKNRQQHGFTDRRIPDEDVRIQVQAHIETMDANAEAAREYTRANRELNKLIDPFVQQCEVGDRLEICDGEIREIKPYARDGFTVEAYEKKRAVRAESAIDDAE